MSSDEVLRQGLATTVGKFLARRWLDAHHIKAYLLSERKVPPFAVRITHLAAKPKLRRCLQDLGMVRSRDFADAPDKYDRKPKDADDYLANSRYRSLIMRTRDLDRQEFKGFVDALIRLGVPWEDVGVEDEEDKELSVLTDNAFCFWIRVLWGRPWLCSLDEGWTKAVTEAATSMRTHGRWLEWITGDRRPVFTAKLREKVAEHCAALTAEQQEYVVTTWLLLLPPPDADFK